MTGPGIVLADGIARFSLDPERRVPLLDETTLSRLGDCITQTGRARAKVLLVTGGTEGVFAAGADLTRLSALSPLEARAFSRKGQDVFDSLATQPFVTLAMVRGRCIGGAFDLVMACDLRVADTTATFSHTGPRLGFITGYGGTSRLPALVGRAARAVLSGHRVLDAAEAEALGLVTETATQVDLEKVTLEIAHRIVRVPAARIALVKEAIRALSGCPQRRRLEGPLTRLAALAQSPGPAGE